MFNKINKKLNLIDKKKKKENIFLIVMIGMILSMLCLCYSIILYESGFHKLDLAQNMKYIDAKYNIKLGDMHNDKNVYTYSEMFVDGYNMMNRGMLGIGYFSFVIGASYILLITLFSNILELYYDVTKSKKK